MLSQEDPTEAFFKSVPTTGKNNTLEVLYPVRTMLIPKRQQLALLLLTPVLHVVFLNMGVLLAVITVHAGRATSEF